MKRCTISASPSGHADKASKVADADKRLRPDSRKRGTHDQPIRSAAACSPLRSRTARRGSDTGLVQISSIHLVETGRRSGPASSVNAMVGSLVGCG